MNIVNVTTNATYAEYPQKVVITVEWDQPIASFTVQNLIFETEMLPGLTITGYTGASDAPAPEIVYLGQTLVKDVTLVTPSTMKISFTVSPFMLGTLRISSQPWNKPLKLSVKNSAGVEGDWSPFLAPGVFSGITCRAYYGVMDPSNSTSIAYSNPLYGTPRLRTLWACNGGVSNAFDGVDIRIGTDPSDMSEKPMVQWDGGNFWWWGADGLMGSKNPLPPYPWDNYYSTNNPATCSGPSDYIFGGYGGLTLETTFLPKYTSNIGFTTLKNKYGSVVASNLTSNFGTSQTYRNYSPCLIFGSSEGNKYTSRNASVGRMERWILANPQNGDPLKDMPATWKDQLPSSANKNCLAPWRLAKSTDPVPMLIQAYIQLNWIYSTSSTTP